MPPVTPEQLATTWLPILGALCAVAAAIWTVSRYVSRQDGMTQAMAELGARVDKHGARINTLSHNLTKIEALLVAAERDRAKLEGKLESTTEALNRAVAGLNRLAGSVSASWDVLGEVAPDLVRSRGNGGK